MERPRNQKNQNSFEKEIKKAEDSNHSSSNHDRVLLVKRQVKGAQYYNKRNRKINGTETNPHLSGQLMFNQDVKQI